MVERVTAASIYDTWARLRGEVRYTPLFQASHFSKPLPYPTDLHFKLELHQITGSFKIRGVTSKIMSADPSVLQNGIVAASGGNHGRAVAYAGWRAQIKTTVVLPVTAPQSKIDLIQSWGAQTIIAGENLDEANEYAMQLALQQAALFIHPYADVDVINGQGTLGVEILQQLPDMDTVVMAIGGGGLISGVGTYLKALKPDIRIIGVEPLGCPTLHESLRVGKIVPVDHITTTVGTLAIAKTSPINFELAKACVSEIVLVSDDEMLSASHTIWQEFGIAAERSGSASFAGLLSGKIKVDPGEKVCALICGAGTDGFDNMNKVSVK